MKKTTSALMLLLCALIWGTSFVAQVKSRSMTPFAYNGIKYALGALTVIVIALIFNRKKSDYDRKTTLKGGIVTGIVLAIASNLQQMGIYLGTQAGKAGFFTGIYTVMVPILALFFFKKKTGYLTWTGVLLAVGGLYMLCMTEDNSPGFAFSDMLVLSGAFFWALHIISIDFFTSKGVNALRFSITQFITCAFLSLVAAFVFEDVNVADILSTKTEIIYGGVMSVGIAFTLQVIGQKGVEPALCAILLSTESLFSVLGGAVILKEKLAFPFGYLGCAAMFVAIVISQIEPKKKKSEIIT